MSWEETSPGWRMALHVYVARRSAGQDWSVQEHTGAEPTVESRTVRRLHPRTCLTSSQGTSIVPALRGVCVVNSIRPHSRPRRSAFHRNRILRRFIWSRLSQASAQPRAPHSLWVNCSGFSLRRCASRLSPPIFPVKFLADSGVLARVRRPSERVGEGAPQFRFSGKSGPGSTRKRTTGHAMEV